MIIITKLLLNPTFNISIAKKTYLCIMEKRIRTLHWLTIITIIAFCAIQCYWLYNRSVIAVEDHKEELYKTVLDVMDEELKLRKEIQRSDIGIRTNTNIYSLQHKSNSTLRIMFDIFVVEKVKFDLVNTDNSELKDIINIYKDSLPSGITHYSFETEGKASSPNEYDALGRFITDLQAPFHKMRLDSLLKLRNIIAEDINTKKVDSMVWHSSKSNHASLLKPKITITYPYDIFDGETVEIVLPIKLNPVISKVAGVFSLTFVLSILLTVCLILQITTIRRQRNLENVRRDYILTMIHELKRPISTLKMCVSFMRNDKFINDKESRYAIIADSCNELDKLTSYFSKLRDMSINNSTDIPISLSTFELKQIFEECVKKLSIPSNKTAGIHIISNDRIDITADKIHISNIINNLLENSIKYSKENVNIEIDYHKEPDCIVISIKDNGLGIPKSDIKFIFDKFYRGKSSQNNEIPGMGLGLAYVKYLTLAHRGSIEVKSEEGIGTTFIIKLPQDE